MKPFLIIAAALVLPAFAFAQTAAKSCEELKSEIAKKMEANGVKSYSLEIVAKDAETEGKVVGTCEGGTKKVVYRRTATTAPTTTTEASKH
jgi:hypothetical protein